MTPNRFVPLLAEVCPACKGVTPILSFWDGTDEDGGHVGGVEFHPCGFCDNTGTVPIGRDHWPVIGARLRRFRERQMVGVVYDRFDRPCFTGDPDVPEQPLPLDLMARRCHVDATVLASIEAGQLDPRRVAEQYGPSLLVTLDDASEEA